MGLRMKFYRWLRTLLREEIGPALLDDYHLPMIFKTMDGEHLLETPLLVPPQKGDKIYLEIKDRWYEVKDVFWEFTPKWPYQQVIHYLDPLDIEDG